MGWVCGMPDFGSKQKPCSKQGWIKNNQVIVEVVKFVYYDN